MENAVLLRSKGIYKAFGPTIALKGVDVEIKRGEIHGIIGENGSGKSTFSSIVAGIQKADNGELFLREENYFPENALDAGSKGISMVAQEQNTIDGITVAANIFIGEEARFTHLGYLNVNAMNRAAKKILDSVSAFHIDPDVKVDNLSFEDRKLVELARSMYVKPELLIVDETTTALTIKGREILYSIMRRMRDEGNSIIFITHDIDEIMNLSDAITILKDGSITANLDKSEFESKKIKQLMVGREIAANFYRTDFKADFDQEVTLKVENITYEDIKGISFELHKGEILGIGGLAECGMHDLGKILFGLLKPSNGSVTAKGTERIHSTESAIKSGIGYVSKNRDMEVLMPVCSIKDNICITSLKSLSKFGLITRKRERDFAQTWTGKLNIKANSVEQFVSALSGGNKQKVALAKWLGKNSDILILDCPTRGIDVGVKAAIYKLMEELKKAGKSILMISEELPEIIGMSDRVLILKDGEVTCEFKRDKELSESKLIEYMI